MKRPKLRGAILATWVLVVAVALFAIQGHERTLQQGERVLLRLAPVDPRSLMQGDYMALRFTVDGRLMHLPDRMSKAGETMPDFAHFRVDALGQAEFEGVGDTPRSGPGRISMRIRSINGRLTVGPNAFFFQEGTGELYEEAQWGGFRVAKDGTALLVSLHDAELEAIGVQQR